MLCGDTCVAAPNLRTHISMQRKVDPETGKTGFEKQLEVFFVFVIQCRLCTVWVYLAFGESKSHKGTLFLQKWRPG